MDGFKGLPEAVNAVFPKNLTQLCIVHLVRASLRYVGSNVSKAVVAALKAIYKSATAEEALREFDAFEEAWGAKYKAVVRLWRGNRDNIIPFFQFLPEIRKVVYTTNAIESLNMVMCKYTRNRRRFRNDDSALKSLFMAIREASKNSKGIQSLEAGAASLPSNVRRRARAASGALSKLSYTVRLTDPAGRLDVEPVRSQ